MVQGTSYKNDKTFRMFPIITGHITCYHEKNTVPRHLTTYIWWQGYKNKMPKLVYLYRLHIRTNPKVAVYQTIH